MEIYRHSRQPGRLAWHHGAAPERNSAKSMGRVMNFEFGNSVPVRIPTKSYIKIETKPIVNYKNYSYMIQIPDTAYCLSGIWASMTCRRICSLVSPFADVRLDIGKNMSR